MYTSEAMCMPTALSEQDRTRIKHAWNARQHKQQHMLRSGSPDTNGMPLASVAYELLGDRALGLHRLGVYCRLAWRKAWAVSLYEAGVKLTPLENASESLYAPFCLYDTDDSPVPLPGIDSDHAKIIGNLASSNTAWAELRAVQLSSDATELYALPLVRPPAAID